jgi:DNA-binding XRE family transcriptional regulator
MSRLLECRERANLSRIGLARKVGVGREWIRRLEVDGCVPSVDSAQRIARALGTTVADLWPPDEPGGAQ